MIWVLLGITWLALIADACAHYYHHRRAQRAEKFVGTALFNHAQAIMALNEANKARLLETTHLEHVVHGRTN